MAERPGRARDRHGRGLRGPLCPPGLPFARTRSEKFDDLVLDAVERLERRWASALAPVELAVEDVPPLDDDVDLDGEVPLGRSVPGDGPLPPRIVVYRRPVELRAPEKEDLGGLVHDVVVEQLADLLGLTPEQVDPRYGTES